jgi:kynurenine formamidase
MIEYRAEFDAEVTFANGGGLQAQGFRLDVPGAVVGEAQLADLFVRHLGLLMVGGVQVRNIRVMAEPHKGSRGGPADRPAAAGTAAGELIDLNHVIEANMVTYPGLPGPLITPHLTRAQSRTMYAEDTEFAIDRISMIGNTGTYLDSPFHRYADGADLSVLPLTALADLPIVVVRLQDTATRGIGPDVLRPLDLAGCAVLLYTGWDKYWGSAAYGREAPYLTGPAAQLLAAADARLVGIDSVNIDDVDDLRRPAHSILLRAGIPVLEHLTELGRIPVTGARLHAAPPRIRGFGTFPVRAYAVLPA